MSKRRSLAEKLCSLRRTGEEGNAASAEDRAILEQSQRYRRVSGTKALPQPEDGKAEEADDYHRNDRRISPAIGSGSRKGERDEDKSEGCDEKEHADDVELPKDDDGGVFEVDESAL